MPDEIIIDGLEEHAFRRSIETLLRHGRADEAAERLKALLPGVAGLLPSRIQDVTTADVRFEGLDLIAARLDEYGRTEAPITAIGIGIADPVDSGLCPDEQGNLRPPLQTTYYSDATFPFSESERDDLLEGYSTYGCEWQGDFDRIDEAISITGIDDLYGAIASLEDQVSGASKPSSEDIRAGAIGACYLGVLVYQAAREAVVRHGLPRPLALLLVNSDAYPFFDAPVLTCDEYREDGAVKVVERAPAFALAGGDDPFDGEEPEETASLMSIVASSPHAMKKKMALALEGEEARNPLGMADELISQAAFEPDSVDLSRFITPRAEIEDGKAESLPLQSASPIEDADCNGTPDPDEGEIERMFRELEFPVEATLPGKSRLQDDCAQDAPSLTEHVNPYLEPAAPQAPCGPRPDSEAPSQPESTSVHMPWHDNAEQMSFAPTAQPPVPATHSLRSKIRVSEQATTASAASGGLLAAIAAFLKRVQDLLLRR